MKLDSLLSYFSCKKKLKINTFGLMFVKLLKAEPEDTWIVGSFYWGVWSCVKSSVLGAEWLSTSPFNIYQLWDLSLAAYPFYASFFLSTHFTQDLVTSDQTPVKCFGHNYWHLVPMCPLHFTSLMPYYLCLQFVHHVYTFLSVVDTVGNPAGISTTLFSLPPSTISASVARF